GIAAATVIGCEGVRLLRQERPFARAHPPARVAPGRDALGRAIRVPDPALRPGRGGWETFADAQAGAGHPARLPHLQQRLDEPARAPVPRPPSGRAPRDAPVQRARNRALAAHLPHDLVAASPVARRARGRPVRGGDRWGADDLGTATAARAGQGGRLVAVRLLALAAQ